MLFLFLTKNISLMNKNVDDMFKLQPPLKWAGGKRWLVPTLQYYWKKHQDRRLVEPFCGGLAVALGLNPDKALLNDLNSALINFYQQLQSGMKVDIKMLNDEELYYQYRESFNKINGNDDSLHLAAQLFYYFNRTGYNGLCRFNKQGGFNVPFGRYKTINYQTDFSHYQAVLERWQFSNKDFELLNVSKDDFIYADPPYDSQPESAFIQYSAQGFSWGDQVRLAEWLANHSGPVIISNRATNRIKQLYKKLGFRLRFIDAPRSISCKGNERKMVKEVLAIRGF